MYQMLLQLATVINVGCCEYAVVQVSLSITLLISADICCLVLNWEQYRAILVLWSRRALARELTTIICWHVTLAWHWRNSQQRSCVASVTSRWLCCVRDVRNLS